MSARNTLAAKRLRRAQRLWRHTVATAARDYRECVASLRLLRLLWGWPTPPVRPNREARRGNVTHRRYR